MEVVPFVGHVSEKVHDSLPPSFEDPAEGRTKEDAKKKKERKAEKKRKRKSSEYPIIEPFQILRARGDIVDLSGRWRSEDQKKPKIVFVSHEWCSLRHPDPTGEQLRVLCETLRKLMHGEYSLVEIAWRCLLFASRKPLTRGDEWEKFLCEGRRLDMDGLHVRASEP